MIFTDDELAGRTPLIMEMIRAEETAALIAAERQATEDLVQIFGEPTEQVLNRSRSIATDVHSSPLAGRAGHSLEEARPLPSQNMITTRYIGRVDAANYLGVSPSTFDKWVRAGRISRFKMSGHVVRYSTDDLGAFLAAHRQVARTP